MISTWLGFGLLAGCGGVPDGQVVQAPVLEPSAGSKLELVTSPAPFAGQAFVTVRCQGGEQLCVGDCNQGPASAQWVRLSPEYPELVAWCRDPDGLVADSPRLDAVYRFQ